LPKGTSQRALAAEGGAGGDRSAFGPAVRDGGERRADPRHGGGEAAFRRVLEAPRPTRHAGRREAAAGGDADQEGLAASAFLPAALAGGVSPPGAPIREVSVRAVSAPVEVARVLIGQAHTAREARIELGGGLFAGSTIHVVTALGGVEVRLGASTEAARLALASALDRVGLHLRSRGIVMRPGAPLDTGSRQSRRDGRSREGQWREGQSEDG
jgi:hypothetical protein